MSKHKICFHGWINKILCAYLLISGATILKHTKTGLSTKLFFANKFQMNQDVWSNNSKIHSQLTQECMLIWAVFTILIQPVLFRIDTPSGRQIPVGTQC